MAPHLFVYGSLRKGFQSPVYEYISRYFHYLGEAKVPGKLVDMGEYPAAVPNGDHWIQLDDYEGVNVEEGETQLYRRELSEVHTPEGTVHAWIYWYNQDVSGRPIIASGDILQYIAEKNK